MTFLGPRIASFEETASGLHFLVDPAQHQRAEADNWRMQHDPWSITPTITLDRLLAKTAAQAFAALRGEIEAVPADGLVPLNLNVPRAAQRGLAVAERIEPLHPVLATLPDFDFGLVESMGSRALAVLHAHDLATEGESRGGTPLSILLGEAKPLRKVMLSSARAMALVGVISSERVAAMQRGRGPAHVAHSLQTLGRLYQERWDVVSDKTPVTLEMVERAVTLSTELNEALGVRELEDDPLREPTDPSHVRAQAFSLFVRAYDECRRGVSFLRWHHGDAHCVVPSLYARGKGRDEANVQAVEAREVAANGHPAEELPAEPRPPATIVLAETMVLRPDGVEERSTT